MRVCRNDGIKDIGQDSSPGLLWSPQGPSCTYRDETPFPIRISYSCNYSSPLLQGFIVSPLPKHNQGHDVRKVKGENPGPHQSPKSEIYILSLKFYTPPHLRQKANKDKVADEHPIPVPSHADLEQLTELHLRATRRVNAYRGIVNEVAHLLQGAQLAMDQELGLPQPHIANILRNIEIRMQLLVDEMLALCNAEIADHALERDIWSQIG
ncbi:hypothetical protein N7453_002358 [Penicillium expansum]|nr:hypothetical protein N7453_002358 [Penicillium expansum]